jgi:hypothetical protein
MQKLKQFIEMLEFLCGWVTAKPRNLIISVVFLVSVFLGLYYFATVVIPFLIVLIGVTIFLCVCFAENISTIIMANTKVALITLEDYEVRGIVKRCIFEAISSNWGAYSDKCILPKSINDIADITTEFEKFNNAPMLKIHLLRKQPDLSDEDLAYMRNAQQGTVNARVQDGFLHGYQWAVQFNIDVPLLKVATIEATATYLHFGILLTNTAVSVQAARLSDKPSVAMSADDTDPLFL